ncbi:MAG: hypothetical protein FWF51_00910 [Chitinivibrionia bacterium]|nr:hypothetical protein [Chitinivibrionia bacterium]
MRKLRKIDFVILLILCCYGIVMAIDPCEGVPEWTTPTNPWYNQTGIGKRYTYNGNLYLSKKEGINCTGDGGRICPDPTNTEYFELVGPCGDDGTVSIPNLEQQFMTLGCDLDNPIIDPYLLEHSVYADNVYYARGSDTYTPKAGIIGTAGILSEQLEVASSGVGGNIHFQSTKGGYFRNVKKTITTHGNAPVSYYEGTPGNSSSYTKLSHPPYSDPDNATITNDGANLRTRADAANNGKFRPRFPKLEYVQSKFTQSSSPTGDVINPGSYGNLILANNSTVYMNAGTYFFNGSVTIGEGAKLLIRKTNDDYKTVIYVKEKFVVASKGGIFAPEGFAVGACGIPDGSSGKILVIAFGTGTETGDNGDYTNANSTITFGSEGSASIGTFIAPHGGMFIMCGATVIGQLLAKDVNFSYAYNSPSSIAGCTRACFQADFFEYVPLAPPDIRAKVITEKFLEDKNWNESLTNPSYTGGYSYSRDKNKDYIGYIKVELEEPYQGDNPLTLSYTVIDGSATIGELTDFPTSDGSAWRTGGGVAYNGQRAFVKSKSGSLTFNRGKQEDSIPILIVDDGDEQTNQNFSLNISGTYTTQSCEGGSGNVGDNRTITIISDDPSQEGIKIISAIYRDTHSGISSNIDRNLRDGYIDEIEIILELTEGITFNSAIAQQIKDKLSLNGSRNFEITGNAQTTTDGFKINVVEKAAKLAYNDGKRDENLPKTSILTDDKISLTGGSFTVSEGGEDIDVSLPSGNITPEDEVAPVILRADYEVSEEDKDTTLKVVFSENLQSLSQGDIYGFFQTSSGDTYYMDFNGEPKIAGKQDEWLYKVKKAYFGNYDVSPATGDSIWINLTGGNAKDLKNNAQNDKTTKAPLRSTRKGKYTLHIIPQPLRLSNGEPKPLDEGLVSHYNLKYNKGAAIILELDGATDTTIQKGKVAIIDPLGNVLTEMTLAFVHTKGKTVAGVAVWNAKNIKGRNVGAGTYLAIVTGEIKYDNDAVEQFSVKKPISVSK